MSPDSHDPLLLKQRFLEGLGGPKEELRTFLEGVHPADTAEWLLDLTAEESWTVLQLLEAEARAEVLAQAEGSVSGRRRGSTTTASGPSSS